MFIVMLQLHNLLVSKFSCNVCDQGKPLCSPSNPELSFAAVEAGEMNGKQNHRARSLPVAGTELLHIWRMNHCKLSVIKWASAALLPR
jgi:hypothetical protein